MSLMFRFLTDVGGGLVNFHFLDIPFFFVISHILSSMFDMNEYLIMDSKVFNVIIYFNFLLAIVE
jgi:hypothetical protein